MTKQEIHEALCKMSDQEKMRLSVACQLNGVSVEDIEEMLANVITGVQAAVEPALQYYRYLGGK